MSVPLAATVELWVLHRTFQDEAWLKLLGRRLCCAKGTVVRGLRPDFWIPPDVGGRSTCATIDESLISRHDEPSSLCFAARAIVL